MLVAIRICPLTADRTWDERLRELTPVIVLDDFAMRELTAPQTDDLYELITERAGKSLILTSSRAHGLCETFYDDAVAAMARRCDYPHGAFSRPRRSVSMPYELGGALRQMPKFGPSDLQLCKPLRGPCCERTSG